MRITALGLVLSLLCGCTEVRYALQATQGQFDLWSRTRDIDEVMADGETDPRTRASLEEVERVLRFANKIGLDSKGNYREYVDLPRDEVVWFMVACQPLSFEPVVWSFPIVGSFPYLGWFRYSEALKIRKRLEARGLDVYVRRVQAYSTGGWFHDPVLSSMIPYGEGAIGELANVLLHELTHANILVNNQSTFNESLASFVGDGTAADYLAERFGKDSAELAFFKNEMAEFARAVERLSKGYRELETLYASNKSDQQKRADKQRILVGLENELSLEETPNNASLMGFKTYNAGLPEFERLFESCGRNWPRFFRAVRDIKEDWFPAEQTDEIAPVIERRLRKPCR